MSKRRILFTGGGGAGTEMIYETLSKKYDVHFADASKDTDVISNVVPVCKKHMISLASQDDFIVSLQGIINNYHIDIIVPGVDEELTKIHELNEFCPNLTIIAPQPEFIQAMLDKKKMHDVFTRNGIPTPRNHSFENVIDGHKYIIKPVVGRGSRGVFQITSKQQILGYLDLHQKSLEDCIIQDKIDGNEYTITVSCNQFGEPIDIVPLLVLNKRGITTAAVYKNHPKIIELVHFICDLFTPKGLFNVQLMENSVGDLLVFEINPRISTTGCFAIKLGCDIVENYESDGQNVGKKRFIPAKLSRTWHNHVRKL